MDLTNLTKDLKGAADALAVLKANNITPAQAIGVAKGLEPILSSFGVAIPTEVHDLLGLLGTLSGS